MYYQHLSAPRAKVAVTLGVRATLQKRPNRRQQAVRLTYSCWSLEIDPRVKPRGDSGRIGKEIGVASCW